MKHRFVADVHLGKLARLLRMFGFDTIYQNDLSKEQLVAIAQNEGRILLTRNVEPGKALPVIRRITIASSTPEMQVRAVLHICEPDEQLLLSFTRCIVCNGKLEPVAKESILSRLQPQTAANFDDFWECDCCHRVYWKGSHYEHMVRLIEKLTNEIF